MPAPKRSEPPRRIRIAKPAPVLDGGRYAVKRTVGDTVAVSADIFRDGHEKLRAVVKYRAPGGTRCPGPLCHMTPTQRFLPAVLSAGLLAFLTLWAASCSRPVDAAPRTVTSRGELTAEERSNIDVFETWKGSVVFIATSNRVVDFWTRDVMSVPSGTGSGFVWDDQGHIVTNLHVIADAAEATVKLADGRDYPASLVGVSQTHDIAVLKILPVGKPLVPVAIGTSDDLRVGQPVAL